MPLETGDKISDLNPLWPLGSDPKSQGDDHLRLVKDVLQKDALTKSFVQEFHDPTGVASWRIVGNTLECWGSVVTDGTGNGTAQFPKLFARSPSVTVSCNSPGAFLLTAQTTSVVPNGINVVASNGGAFGSYTVFYHAAGEWDGVS